MKIIGLTGSVGSGKSTVGALMEKNFSVKMRMTDNIGHLSMEPGQDSYQKIVEYFGTDILREDESIDRNRLSGIVFSDVSKLEVLNGIIHPWVKAYLRRDIEEEQKSQRFSYYVIESAILFQTRLNSMCTEVWYVDAKEEIRRERLKKNRGYSDEKVDAIMRQQRENEQWKLHCDRIIENNRDETSILEQLENYLVS